jgi:hypothetical protein
MKLLTQYEVEQLRDASRYDGQPKRVSGRHGKLSDAKASAGRELVGVMRGRPTPEALPTGNVSTLQATIDNQAKRIAKLEAENATLSAKLDEAHARIISLESPQSTIESPTMAINDDTHIEGETAKQRYDRLNKGKRAAAAKARRAAKAT